MDEISTYNHNYYKCTISGNLIYEECDELNCEFRFWKITEDEKIWLGASEDDITAKDVIEIHSNWV